MEAACIGYISMSLTYILLFSPSIFWKRCTYLY